MSRGFAMRTKLMTLAAENGFSHAAPVDMNALTPRREVREMCRADRCGQWNANWACPPGCGTLEDAAAAMGCFDAGVLVQGIADLVLVYPDHLELLDYKTDRRKAESDFLRAYRAQLNLYAIAIEKRFAPKKVTYKGIYSFALGKLIEA